MLNKIVENFLILVLLFVSAVFGLILGTLYFLEDLFLRKGKAERDYEGEDDYE